MPVITIADFNSKRPATSLLLTQESRNVSTSKHTPLDEMLPQMPGMLGYSLDLILSEFDYNNEPTTNIGIACRILASLTEYFENNCGGDSHE